MNPIVYVPIFVVLWYVIGCISFVYWWTTFSDLTKAQVPLVAFVGLIGPIAFLFGALIHWGDNQQEVLLRKRK